MLVHFPQTLTATEMFKLGRFGEVSLATGRLYTPTAITTPGAAASAQEDMNNRSRIVLDDGSNQQDIDPVPYPQGGLSATNTLRVGDTVPGLSGVLSFGFSTYRIEPIGPISFNHTNPRTATPPPVGGNLKIASFNVLNFFNGNGSGLDGAAGGFPTSRGANNLLEFNRQLAKEVSALKAMNADIVGLMEIENDSGPSSAVAELVANLNAAVGAGTYAFIDTGVIGTDAIKVALIYKPAAVTPVGAEDDHDGRPIRSSSTRRTGPSWRRPSRGTRTARSHGGRQPPQVEGVRLQRRRRPGHRRRPGQLQPRGRTPPRRWSTGSPTDPTGSGDPDFLLIGDFNSYTRGSDPDPHRRLHEPAPRIRRPHGVLVRVRRPVRLSRPRARDRVAGRAGVGATEWHINADEPTVMDYNLEFKRPNRILATTPTPYRSSDHDPVVVGLNLTAPLTVTADNQSRLFGQPNPPLTYEVTGFAGTENASVVTGTASCTTTATPASPAGTYPITCTVGTLSAPGYTFSTFVPGVLTVSYSSPCLDRRRGPAR